MSIQRLPPNHVKVLVIGGGPAGSYAAAALAREGVDVSVLEAAKFPRYHVGESLIPSVRHYLRFIGAEEKLSQHGFVRKPGSAIKFNQYKREGYTDFVALGHNNNAWNVVRSEFDQILMNHSRDCGASVFELTRVNSLQFSDADPSKPVSVTWTHTPPGAAQFTGQTSFEYLIDASGRAGILSTSYLKNRRFNASLKNIAVWGYWKGVGTYGLGTSREGAPWFEALTDESGWAWFIPLHDGTTSIGIVMNQKAYNKKAKQSHPRSHLHSRVHGASTPSNASPTSAMASRYLSNISLAPGVTQLIASGVLVNKTSTGDTGSSDPIVRSASDFSYSAPQYAGNGYRIIGDAGAFIDPFFSSGVHLALTSALSAASSICAALRGDCTEQEAAIWHTRRVSVSYTRFQVVVLSAYKQIRAQNVNVLSDIDEDNYDRAFSFLRPVIQGASDMGARLSETELQKSLDFCVNLFNPTTPEQHARVARQVSKELLDVASPVMDPSLLESVLRVEKFVVVACGGKTYNSSGNCAKAKEWADVVGNRIARGINGIVRCVGGSGTSDCVRSTNANAWSGGRVRAGSESSTSDSEKVAETQMVLQKINARRVVHSEYGINNLESEPLDGFVVRLESGRLGLVRVQTVS